MVYRRKIKLLYHGDYSNYYEYFMRTETYIGQNYLANFNKSINYYLLDEKNIFMIILKNIKKQIIK